ncbi:MAG: prepilin-type N-terminal cleavage/methylation domain-containing protein [Acidimicrobiales bacterium]
MLSIIKKRLGKDEDEGFTLIELMVVVLIIAILLAIAIPTFLGARNTANARATQSDLRNALTAEATVWTNTQAYTADGSAVESSLTWATVAPTTEGGNVVFATVGDTGNMVELQAYGKDGDCYAVLQSNDPAMSFTAYGASTGACTAPAAITLPTTAPTAAAYVVGAAGAPNWTTTAW